MKVLKNHQLKLYCWEATDMEKGGIKILRRQTKSSRGLEENCHSRRPCKIVMAQMQESGRKSSLEGNTKLAEQHSLNSQHKVTNLNQIHQPQTLNLVLPQNSGRPWERRKRIFPFVITLHWYFYGRLAAVKTVTSSK